MIDGAPLPVHGVVLAGGKSSRMGCDKALLLLDGTPLVQRAVKRLRCFCSTVSISGNRADLERYAPVIPERRTNAGPGAGLEAGLSAASEPWVLFTPVDVPLVSPDLLRAWATEVLRAGVGTVRVSYLRAMGVRQPAFCMLHSDALAALVSAMEQGERKLGFLFDCIAGVLGPGSVRVVDAEDLVFGNSGPAANFEIAFHNINTAADLADVTSSPSAPVQAPLATTSRGSSHG